MTLPELKRGGKERRKSWRSEDNLQLALGPNRGTDRIAGAAPGSGTRTGTEGRAGEGHHKWNRLTRGPSLGCRGAGGRGWGKQGGCGRCKMCSGVHCRGQAWRAGLKEQPAPGLDGLPQPGAEGKSPNCSRLGGDNSSRGRCERLKGLQGERKWGASRDKLQAESSVQDRVSEIRIVYPSQSCEAGMAVKVTATSQLGGMKAQRDAKVSRVEKLAAKLGRWAPMGCGGDRGSMRPAS